LRILHAANFAARKHKGQQRKGADKAPYINHLLEVAEILSDTCGDDDLVLLLAALLHDTVEDAGVAREQLAAEFGNEVAEVVLEVTDDKSLPKAERKRLQVVHAPHKSARAKLLKIADKISNLRDLQNSPPPDWPVERRVEYFEWARAVVEGCRGGNPRLDALFDETYQVGLENVRNG
jgi:GTP diphosphokinase / guanosine-3',5'-bis(diphosphate) 3'-diphosphatase